MIQIACNFIQLKFEKLKNHFLHKKLLLIPLIFIFIILALLGTNFYPGEKLQYIVFSIHAYILLYFGLAQRFSFFFLFLSIFLWLGFWFKLTIHTVFNYPFVEPVGSFLGSGNEWDQLLLTADVAFCGVILGGVIAAGILGADKKLNVFLVKLPAPWWYFHIRKSLWAVLLLAIVIVAMTNIYFGVHQVGIVSRTIFYFPVNAVISWLLNIGLATCIATLVWWDISIRRPLGLSAYAILFEAFFSSISIMSRAAYVFHAIPQFFALKKNIGDWTLSKKILFIFVFAMGLMLSISAVSSIRNYLYQTDYLMSTEYQGVYAQWEVLSGRKNALIKMHENILDYELRKKYQAEINKINEQLSILAPQMQEAEKKFSELRSGSNSQIYLLANEFGYHIAYGSFMRIFQLAIDRWIGLEGLMATEAYSEKGLTLFLASLSRRSDIKSSDSYQKISMSIYMKPSDVFSFRSLPGIVAFMNYSGSKLLVFTGMFLVVVVFIFVERGIFYSSGNPIVTSLYSAELANNIAQFGGDPLQTLKYFLILIMGLGCIVFINSDLLNRLLDQLGVTPAHAIDEGKR